MEVIKNMRSLNSSSLILTLFRNLVGQDGNYPYPRSYTKSCQEKELGSSRAWRHCCLLRRLHRRSWTYWPPNISLDCPSQREASCKALHGLIEAVMPT
ncbi:hypothetical protein EYC84_001165 [Monilinia fructicola]|uniref:Uncharacterized protein n=1 Tax=Monilinia fructicola TaxID=38448 RepID=A0A5M9JLE0_MONFR|nr:hypothetical protein EYC84_001165 [Monilinia fructicola]